MALPMMFRIRSADLAGAIERCVFRTMIVRGGIVVVAGAAAAQRGTGTSTEIVGMRSSALIIFGKLPHDWTRDIESIGGHEKLRCLEGVIGAGHKKLSVRGRRGAGGRRSGTDLRRVSATAARSSLGLSDAALRPVGRSGYVYNSRSQRSGVMTSNPGQREWVSAPM